MNVGIGSDHAGLELKRALLNALAKQGVAVKDFGVSTSEPVDYPDYAESVARAVADGRCELGILVCGTGIGMAIAANKIAGVRAANCHTEYEALMARRHNQSNVLALGGRVLTPEIAERIVRVFIETTFEGGRHAQRVDKIRRLEGTGR